MQTWSVEIRAPTAEDNTALARIFRESWELAYRGVIPARQLDEMILRRENDLLRRKVAQGRDTIVLECVGELAGYATLGRARSSLGFEGEIYELYLAPVYQGLGLGVWLFESAREKLDSAGLNGLIVWALEDNVPACDFYRRRGGRPVARTVERFGRSSVDKIGFGWN